MIQGVDVQREKFLLLDNLKQTIHPSQIDIKQEINKKGSFPFSVNLHSEVVVELRVVVEKIEVK